MRNLYSLVFILLALCGCKKDVIGGGSDFLSVSKDAVFLNADASVETIEIEAGSDWRIEGVPSWCGTVQPSSGKAGKHSVRIRGRFYYGEEDRAATFSVICGKNVKNVQLVQYKSEKFDVQLSSRQIPAAGGNLSVSIKAESQYTVTIEQEGEWLSKVGTENPLDGTIVFSASDNNADERKAVIVFSIPERGFRKEFEVTQLDAASESRYIDGQVIELNKSTREKALNVVILGDGFTKTDLEFDGNFKSMVDRAYGALFSCEPMTSYKNYFNVYAVVTESQESGTGVVTPKNTALKTYFFDEIAVTMNLDDNAAYTYMEKTGITDRVSTIVIVLVNSTRTGGVTITWSDGRAICICTDTPSYISNGMEGILRHEVVGHSIGKLDEEYMYISGSVTDAYKIELKTKHSKGYSLNIDTTNDPNEVAWKHFIGVKGYEKVGCYWFEGGCIFSGGGVCKSEDAPSCMANNVAYFDAPSREQIVKHIKEAVGETYSFEDFIKEDKLRGK